MIPFFLLDSLLAIGARLVTLPQRQSQRTLEIFRFRRYSPLMAGLS